MLLTCDKVPVPRVVAIVRIEFPVYPLLMCIAIVPVNSVVVYCERRPVPSNIELLKQYIEGLPLGTSWCCLVVMELCYMMELIQNTAVVLCQTFIYH